MTPAAEQDPTSSRLHPPTHSLDPDDWRAFRAQAHRMLDDILTHTQTLLDRPFWQPVPDDLRDRLTGPIPTQPTALADVHQQFLRDILPYALGNLHPGFMGWVHGGGTPVGILAEMLAAGLNANCGGRDHAPLAVEAQLTAWMRQLFQFPGDATGLCTSGTSTSNLIAILIARDRGLAAAQGKLLAAYTSTAAHHSIDKAFHIAGLSPESLRKVPVDADHRIDLHALQTAIAADLAAGHHPFLLIASAGTVDTGAIDDLAALAVIAAHHHLHFHIDGAFGALAILVPQLAPLLRGIECADTLAFDFHKWLQVPYQAGFLLARSPQAHLATFASPSRPQPYLHRELRGMAAGAVWPCDLGIELSRGFRALKVWFAYKVFGTDALGQTIAQTCRLAQYLADRIRATVELELLAPVPLNIVCFRYRSRQPDSLNRKIATQLQEFGRVAPSTTRIHGSVALRAAIVNHRTTYAEIDTLIEQTLISGRALESALTQQPIAGDSPIGHERTLTRLALDSVEARLRIEPASTDLRYQHSCLLDLTGQSERAEQGYRDLLLADSVHIAALNNLGNILLAGNRRDEARALYQRAVSAEPGHLPSRANLGNLLIKQGEAAAAAEHFHAALAVDRTYRPAHAGLSFALVDLGDPAAATEHRRQAFAGRSISITAYRGEHKPITLLELVSTMGGNIRSDTFLSDRVFQRILITTEFFRSGTPLPPHQLVLNAIGEADGARAALEGAKLVLTQTNAPVINPPDAVLATGRCQIAARLAHLPNVRTARTILLDRQTLEAPTAAETLYQHGLEFPLLLRAPGFHGGENFHRADTSDELPAILAQLPGDELLAIEYLDARGPDGQSRKYRAMLIDGRLYPLHLAISPHWKIHYHSADMAENAANRAEDEAFLEDMPRVLGPQAMAALHQIQQTLALDYAGIDFCLTPTGEILVFEANATMVVVVPDRDPRWDYRRAPVERIYKAIWTMLRNRALMNISGDPSQAAPRQPEVELQESAA